MKNQVISSLIIANVNSGMALREALDAVLGNGTYDQIASDVYDALRAA